MFWPSRKRMTARTITNTKCPIPNEGGFDDPSFPVFKLYRSFTPRHFPLHNDRAVFRSGPVLTSGRRTGNHRRLLVNVDGSGTRFCFHRVLPSKGNLYHFGHPHATV